MKKLLTLLMACVLGLNLSAQNLADAQAAVEAEQYDKARTILEKLVADNPADGQYNFHLGSVYLLLGEDAKAKECFDKGVTAAKNPAINYIGLGEMLLNDGKPAEAAADFEKATIKLKKKDTDEYLAIAKAYIRAFNPDYDKAAEYAARVVAINPNLAVGYLTLGDAEYNRGSLNEAYSAYRTAFELDNTLLRAKLHLAVITKNAQAFPEAIQAIDEIIAINPSYGPAYRELAEIHYMWAIVDPAPGAYAQHIAEALKCYDKYMTFTDNSLDSRMRHADFLVLAKDYVALEKEAAEMQKIDKVNPRILRYLGYSAYENGNYAEAAKAINDFMKVVEPRRVLGMDYLYLAKADARMLEGQETASIDKEKLANMLNALSKAISMETIIENEFTTLGRRIYKDKDYVTAASIFETLITAPKPDVMDQVYYANSVFYGAAAMDSLARVAFVPEMQKADSVYAVINTSLPTTLDFYFNRARLNSYYIPGAEAKGAELFQKYIDVATEKGEEELAKPNVRSKMSDCYASIGAYYSDIDKPRAIAAFEKAVEFDPTNEHAVNSLSFLQKK